MESTIRSSLNYWKPGVIPAAIDICEPPDILNIFGKSPLGDVSRFPSVTLNWSSVLSNCLLNIPYTLGDGKAVISWFLFESVYEMLGIGRGGKGGSRFLVLTIGGLGDDNLLGKLLCGVLGLFSMAISFLAVPSLETEISLLNLPFWVTYLLNIFLLWIFFITEVFYSSSALAIRSTYLSLMGPIIMVSSSSVFRYSATSRSLFWRRPYLFYL